MPPNFQTIQAQAQIINDNGSKLLQAVSSYNTLKVGGVDLTAGMKTALKDQGLTALTAVETAAAAIRTELAVV